MFEQKFGGFAYFVIFRDGRKNDNIICVETALKNFGGVVIFYFYDV